MAKLLAADEPPDYAAATVTGPGPELDCSNAADLAESTAG